MIANLIDQGGWVMYLLLACSVVGSALILERTWFWIRTWPRLDQNSIDKLLESIRNGESLDPTKNRSNLICKNIVLASADKEFRKRANHYLNKFRSSSRRFLTGISTLVGIAPMLGIFGTILGIIQSFRIMSGATITDLDAISVGIAEALITTATGLAIAMPCVVFYNLFLSLSRKAETRYKQAIEESATLIRQNPNLEQYSIEFPDTAQTQGAATQTDRTRTGKNNLTDPETTPDHD